MGKKYCQALKELRNDKSIVVNEADKGGTVVIMNPEYYEKMIHKQLEDKNTCKKVDPSCDPSINESKHALIKKYENSFLKQKIDYLTNF